MGDTAAASIDSTIGMDSIRRKLERRTLNIILSVGAFDKTRFLGMLADSTPLPVAFVDTDLLYAGYIRSGMHKKRDGLFLSCPDTGTWNAELVGIISAASKRRTAVIVDSLNGVYEMFQGPDSIRAANSCMMILSSLAGQAGSSVTVGAIVQRRADLQNRAGRNDGGAGRRMAEGRQKYAAATPAAGTDVWVTSPRRRQIIGPTMPATGVYLLKWDDSFNPILEDVAASRRR